MAGNQESCLGNLILASYAPFFGPTGTHERHTDIPKLWVQARALWSPPRPDEPSRPALGRDETACGVSAFTPLSVITGLDPVIQ